MDINELVGMTLGSCALERIIGRGGMGAVFLAQQVRPVRTVAVKVLLPPESADADDRRVYFERFRREADTVARLEHKNILPIFEYDEAVVEGERLAYLVMPYIRGGTLRERIDEMKRAGKQFDLNTISNYIGQVADALSYAHSLGVIHRDVKPANLLFHPDGRLLLSDFGIVRLSAMPALTTVGNFLGTAEYASAEQAGGGDLDARSDIYSLGCILFELLTGHVPFSGSNPFAILSKHIGEPVPSIKYTRPDLSPAIEFVVKKALAKNPEDRYQHATEMAADLQAAISPAVAAPGKIRLGGAGSNSDLTEAAPAPPGQWQWNWPSQTADAPQNAPLPQPTAQAMANGISATAPATKPGRRLYFYGMIVIVILFQLLALGLLLAPPTAGSISPAVLGILSGAAINLLILATIGFTGVTRRRPIKNYIYRLLLVVLIVPIVSGIFIGFGAPARPHDLNIPIVSYALLLLSNIYGVRILGAVDARYEQVEVVPVFWRSAIIGALTGLLPLTMILILTLTVSFPSTPAQPLLRIFGMLLIALIGAPTPGAVMAVWLSRKMTFPTLIRSSAIAGLLMFASACLLAIFWSALTSNHALFFAAFKQTGLAFLIGGSALALLGALRGMLDAWVYQRITRRKKP
ncbi:MAG TPA: protein kinase [Ktedonobacteraceae bacterium]|nr:protein kinase [Ktedonobacteraceae bacterium]